MEKKKTPHSYLSKRENGTYCIICGYMPVNDYTDKETCLKVAKQLRIELSEEVWSAKELAFIVE